MKGLLLLTWRYMLFHKLKSIILLICITITITLPVAVHFLVRYYEQELVFRARTTPLLLGARGSRFSLVLKGLYYTFHDPEQITWQEHLDMQPRQNIKSIPLYLEYTATGRQLVGTTYDYFKFRNLKLAAGTYPLQLGEAVLGAEVARETGLKINDTVLSDKKNLFNLMEYPLRMRITGILAPGKSPDDNAVFTDIKTTWIISGHLHGHQDLSRTRDETLILKRDKDAIVGSPKVQEYSEITKENIDTFHLHARPADLPVSVLIINPVHKKARILFMTAVNQDSQTLQVIEPLSVIKDLISIVFQIKRFFNANFLLISIVTGLFLVLVILLTAKIRERERQTLFKIGASRMTQFWLQTLEVSIIMLISFIFSGIFSIIMVLIAPDIGRMV